MIINRNGILAAEKYCKDHMYIRWAPIDCEYVSKVSSKVSVKGASTIFGIASCQIQMVSLQRSFIIQLQPVFLFTNGCDNIAAMS